MRQVAAIALNTAREAIRNRILYSILFFAVLMVGISAVFGAASIGDQTKYMKDFSLMSVSLFGVIIAIVLGVNLLHQELGKKTIVNILSKPVARWQFIVGKFLGLFGDADGRRRLHGGRRRRLLRLLTGHARLGTRRRVGATLLEIMVVIAVALFFSSLVVTPSLAGMFTAATFVAGRSPATCCTSSATITRRRCAPSHRASTGRCPGSITTPSRIRSCTARCCRPEYVAVLAGYACAYAGVLLLISVAMFSRREFV